jgi:hypothetical protein
VVQHREQEAHFCQSPGRTTEQRPPAKAFEREYGDGQEPQRSTAGLVSESIRPSSVSEVMPAPARRELPKQGPVEPVVSVEQRAPGYEARMKANEERLARERARAHDYLRQTWQHGERSDQGL